jgi:hypothetical protein
MAHNCLDSLTHRLLRQAQQIVRKTFLFRKIGLETLQFTVRSGH